MRRMFALAACLVAIFPVNAALAATVQPIAGTISVNTGEGFKPAVGETNISTGDTVMVSPEGSARIIYADGCAIQVRPGAVVTIGQGSPCAAVPMGATKTKDTTPTDHYIIGGLLVAGGIAGAIVLISDDDDKSSSGH